MANLNYVGLQNNPELAYLAIRQMVSKKYSCHAEFISASHRTVDTMLVYIMTKCKLFTSMA